MRPYLYSAPTPEEWAQALEHEPLLNFFTARILREVDEAIFDFDILKSYGWEGLVAAIRSWNPEKGSFPTYAWPKVRTAINRWIREELAQRGKARPSGPALDPADVLSFISLEDLLEGEGDIREDEGDPYTDLYQAVEELEPDLRKVISLRYFGTPEHPRGFSSREISEAMGWPWEKNAQRAEERAIKRLREILAEQREAA